MTFAAGEAPAGLTWFFGYGSLIWRPDFPYRAREPAVLDGWQRAFCRYSLHHRGTPQRPGLVIGLREGDACVGVAYGVEPAALPATLAYLDDREGAGYRRRELPLRLGRDGTGATVPAWVYVPDPAHSSYFGDSDPARLATLVAQGRGASGTALDYLRDLIAHLAELNVQEPALATVLAAAEALAAQTPPTD